MPKFNDHQRQAIGEQFIEHARNLFTQFGLKKTSIADITTAVGVAQGTFYLFYRSKEELFLDILLLEERSVHASLSSFLNQPKMNRSQFRQFLLHSISLVENNPLLKWLYDADTMNAVIRKLSPEKQAELFQQDKDTMKSWIERGQAEGWIAAREPDHIVSLMQAVVLVALQKQQIGEDRYAVTLELLCDCIAQGIIQEESTDD
ncbi:TetR/AcrR family transcriptional regulator [Paenibacillus arenosi]|uniref:TetR/AcrR family transcriptional regulator n=1 Tax=Paenibacillus arenosi TaxID=2774142 RepID=A0ABR9AV03_9BACL|nr:TetR/AcrR family transcriptional regulator [Paenibacillus arenosi]MBD8497847.1 TetR/AcrR family transcriptional regulator [Paenibacillus arenosi]